MDKVVSLSQIGLYNPRRQNSELSERLFVIRQKQFEMLMEAITDEEENSIPQHHIIIAQRGMGKTTMLHRIAIELHKSAYNDRFIPLAFPEEQYTVTNLDDFWLNCLDALADSLELEHYDANEVKQIDNRVKELSLHKDLEETAAQAYKFLMETCQTLKRRPVLLVDNIGLLFNRLSKDDQHSLRAVLSENGAPIVLGAGVVILPSQTNNKANVVKAITEYEAPFYDYFQIHYLKKLTFEEFLDLIKNLSSVTNSDISSINKERPRLQTLHQLTGGNPRTAVMLFKLIVNGFSTEINDDLEALLDEITPLYKARYEEISEQSQKIIATIALNWDAISLKKLSQQSGYANNQLSPQLKRLIEEGWIETTPAEKAKGNAYYISERFFNIWFIMRMSTRRKKQEIIFLSRFLESFYGEEIHNMALKLSRKRRFIDLNQISCSFALAESKKVQLKTRRKLKEKATEALFEFAKENPKILEQYDISEDYLKKINKLTLGEIMNNCNGVLDKLELLQSANPNDIKLLLFMGELYQNIDLLDKAEMQYEKTLEIDKNNATAWYELGNIYAMKEKYTDAIRYLEKANELKPNEFWYLANLAGLYYEAKIYEKAESAYKQLVEKNMNDGYAWHMLGNVCVTTKEYKEAELAYKKSILLKDSIFSKYDLMVLYRDNLNKLEEAESLFSTIYIELQQDEILYLLNQSLFNLYKQDLGQAKDKFHEISSFIKDDCPYFTKYTGGNDDEWCRYAAIVINLNYGSWFLQILEEKGYDISLSPYYTAIKALEIEKQDSKNGKKNAEIYLKNRAIEISEPARMIMEKIRKYM